eukprot:UN00875
MIRSFGMNKEVPIVLKNFFDRVDANKRWISLTERTYKFHQTNVSGGMAMMFLKEMFRIADKDKDGKISWKEFQIVMNFNPDEGK